MKITINHLIELIHEISPIYNSPDFREVMRLNFTDKFTKPFSGIIRRTLRDFELKYPLFMWDREVYNCGNKIMFKDNYDQFLLGQVAEKYLELIPTSILHYTTGLLSQYRDFTYDAPILKLGRQGKCYISYFTKYPYRLTIDKHKDEFTEDAHIYGIDESMGDPFTYFMFILEYNLLEYLNTQKQQMSYQELPLEIYQGIDDRLNTLKDNIDDWYQNPTWYAKLFI